MKNIIANIHRGGGRIMNYLLATGFALVAAQSAWAANGTWIDGTSGNIYAEIIPQGLIFFVN